MEYVLYLDESDKRPKEGLKYFCLCGWIICTNVYNEFEYNLRKLKKDIFNEENLILRRSYALKRDLPPYKKLLDDRLNKKFWRGINELIIKYATAIIGGVIDKDSFSQIYNCFKNQRTSYFVLMQVVMENYAYFLEKINATGSIIADERSEKAQITSHYYNIMANGTLYIDKNIMQNRILGLKWCTKEENSCGLQLADFISNPVNHYFSKTQYSEQKIMSTIKKKLYDGELGDKKRFGIRILLVTNP
jgi:hypothetical protein